MDKKRNLTVIYPSRSKKNSYTADFCTLLAFLNECDIQYRLIKIQLESKEEEAGNKGEIETLNNGAVYIHINDITLLADFRNLPATLKSGNNLVIIGGHPAITLQATEILKIFESIDVVVRTPEEDKTLVDLLKTVFFKNQQLLDIPGITFRQPADEPNGCRKIVVNGKRELSENIDHINNTAIFKQNLMDSDLYPVFISLGCNYNCQYCTVPVPYLTTYDRNSDFLRRKSVMKIVDEIELLVAKGKTKFQFYCNQFFDEMKTPAAIAEKILERRLEIKFSFVSKINDIYKNLESLPILMEAGLENIHVGLDSGVARFNKMYLNGVTAESSINALKFMNEQKIDFDISYILYDPYLTPEELRETLRFLKNIEKFFSHLKLPYCAYLDSRILGSTLILKHGMPIIRQLKNSQLLVDYPDYTAHPSAKFANQDIKKVYSIHSAVNNKLLPKVRHFFYNKALVGKYSFLNRFPLQLIESILDSVLENKFEDFECYVQNIESFIKSEFKAHFDTIDPEFDMYLNRELEQWINEPNANTKN